MRNKQNRKYSVVAQTDLLGAMRDAEEHFFDRIRLLAEDHRNTHPCDVNGRPITEPENEDAFVLTEEEKRQLRLEGIVHLAELLYLLEVSGIARDAKRLCRWLHRHNETIIGLKLRAAQGDPEIRARKLSPQRLDRGILTDYQIEAMVLEASDQGLRFDQTSLGALLIKAMSPESTRILIQLMARCGFLTRVRRASTSIRSTGILESVFQDYLCEILEEANSTSVSEFAKNWKISNSLSS